VNQATLARFFAETDRTSRLRLGICGAHRVLSGARGLAKPEMTGRAHGLNDR